MNLNFIIYMLHYDEISLTRVLDSGHKLIISSYWNFFWFE